MAAPAAATTAPRTRRPTRVRNQSILRSNLFVVVAEIVCLVILHVVVRVGRALVDALVLAVGERQVTPTHLRPRIGESEAVLAVVVAFGRRSVGCFSTPQIVVTATQRVGLVVVLRVHRPR